ncbi:MAG TPA: 4Fe-4S dicluster domain-containing protein [Phycisphaerae bacterium]|nr:4Fe-4S dicluster domain-containing protein [Phycisphaerae bacterium]
MLPRMLPKASLGEFVEYLMSEGRVAGPVAKGPQFAFETIESPRQIERIRMDYDVTILPPKKYLMPQRETLLRFDGADPAAEQPLVSAEPTVILGVHPYDLHGIATTDAAFSQSPADANYLARRAATRLIGMNIGAYVDEHQFMADMGTVEPPEGGFDLFLTDLGESYYVEVGTPAGSGLADGSGVMTQAGPEDHKAKQDFDARKASQLTKRLPYNVRYLPELLDANYDSLLWDAIARRCFSCGTCTNVCPTCYCFDVQDKLNLDAASGRRQRMWDSCQLKSFAEVAGGENFRAHRAGRFRHRVFRKGKYILQRTGGLGCVGCGRCSRHCVADISILEAFQQIAEETAELEA